MMSVAIMSEQKSIRASEAAEMIGVSLRTVVRWIHKGYFPNAKRVNPRAGNSTYIIPETEVEQFIQERDKDKLN